MTSFTESIVEQAALACFEALGYAVVAGPSIAVRRGRARRFVRAFQPNKLASLPVRGEHKLARIQRALAWAFCALCVTGCTSSENTADATTGSHDSTSDAEAPGQSSEADLGQSSEDSAEAPSASTLEPDVDTAHTLPTDDPEPTDDPAPTAPTGGDETTTPSSSETGDPVETDEVDGGGSTVSDDAGTGCEFGTYEYHAWRYDDEGDCFPRTSESFVACASRPTTDGFLLCNDLAGNAIAPDGTCWSFPSLCFPAGWTDISGSSPAIEHPCNQHDFDIEDDICGSSLPDASAPVSDASVDGGG